MHIVICTIVYIWNFAFKFNGKHESIYYYELDMIKGSSMCLFSCSSFRSSTIGRGWRGMERPLQPRQARSFGRSQCPYFPSGDSSALCLSLCSLKNSEGEFTVSNSALIHVSLHVSPTFLFNGDAHHEMLLGGRPANSGFISQSKIT